MSNVDASVSNALAELIAEIAALEKHNEILTTANAKHMATIERIKPLFDLTLPQVQLATGEMSAQEWRTVSAVLNWLNTKLQAALNQEDYRNE